MITILFIAATILLILSFLHLAQKLSLEPIGRRTSLWATQEEKAASYYFKAESILRGALMMYGALWSVLLGCEQIYRCPWMKNLLSWSALVFLLFTVIVILITLRLRNPARRKKS